MTATPADTVTAVLTLANRAHTEAADAGLTDWRDALAAEAGRWKDDVLTVVVAGAQNRGKSRLLNALGGHRDLLPVDADVATGTRVHLEYADTPAVTVTRRDEAGRPVRSVVAADRVAAHVAVDGADRAGVVEVVVGVPRERLRGLRLVDTPGVDGLTLGHRHTTVSALHTADGLLLCVGAQDQPVLRHELEFAAEAAARVPSVAFVLTKIDDSAAWPELLAENRARLATFTAAAVADGRLDAATARRLEQAPWVPVSAALAEAADDLAARGRDARAGTRRERSGLPALTALLGSWSRRRRVARAAAVLTLVEGVARALDDLARDEAAVGSGDDDALARRRAGIDDDLERLRELRRARRRSGIDQQFLGQEAARRARVRMEGHRRAYEIEIAGLHSLRELRRYRERLPEALEGTLTAAWEEIAADTRDLAATGLAEHVRRLGLPPVGLDTGLLDRRPRPDGAVRVTDGPAARGVDVIADGLPSVMMASSISFASAHLLGLGVGLAFAGPVAVGVAVAGVFLIHKRRLTEAAHTRTALTKGVNDVVGAAAGEMVLTAQQAVATWRSTVDQTVDELLDARRAELEQRRAAVAEEHRRDAGRRRDATARAERRAGAVRELTGRVQQLRGALDDRLAAPPTCSVRVRSGTGVVVAETPGARPASPSPTR